MIADRHSEALYAKARSFGLLGLLESWPVVHPSCDGVVLRVRVPYGGKDPTKLDCLGLQTADPFANSQPRWVSTSGTGLPWPPGFKPCSC